MPVSCCGKKPFGNVDVQQYRSGEGDEKSSEGRALVIQHEIEAAGITGQDFIEAAFDEHVGLAVPRVLFIA